MEMPVTTLILDADGVLINGDRFADIRARDFKGNKVKEKEFFSTHFQDCLIGKADLKESIAPYLPSFGWTGTTDAFLEFWFKAEHSINQELVQYIQKLRSSGVRVVLATNQEKYRTQYMVEQMGFGGMFDKIYASAHLGLKKPAVEFFEHVIKDLGASKGGVLFWDDDPRNIEGARDYGIKAEFYTDYAAFQSVMSQKYGFA